MIIRKYKPDVDYLRVRQFLINTFSMYKRPFNWLLDRWNFCRYFAVPVHTFFSIRYFSIPTLTHTGIRNEIAVWEDTIWIWETTNGEIAAVLLSANEEPGEAWFQIHPECEHLYGEMLMLAEENLADRVGNTAFIKLYINEGTPLEKIAANKKYWKLKERHMHKEYRITGSEKPLIPEGFSIKSVANSDNIDERRKAKSIAFGGGYAPSDWPPAEAFLEMQKAPDYRKELDLYIEAPNGDYAAFCTVWLDERNRYANFEPVGTRADYQGMGLAKALLAEGFSRMAEYGVVYSFMDSPNEFYTRIGFKETPYTYYAWVKYF